MHTYFLRFRSILSLLIIAFLCVGTITCGGTVDVPPDDPVGGSVPDGDETTIQPQVSLEKKKQWEAWYRDVYGTNDPFLDGPWKQGNHFVYGERFAWNAHHLLRAYLSIGDTFDDVQYLRKAKTLIDHILLHRDDRLVVGKKLDVQAHPYNMAPLFYRRAENLDKGAKGWRRSFNDEIRIEVLIDGQICNAIMRFVTLVHQNSKYSEFEPFLSAYVADCAETLAMHEESFVFDRTPNVPGLYYYPSHAGTHLYGGGTPLNHNLTALHAGLLIDKYYGKQDFRAKAEAVIQYFRKNVKFDEQKDLYEWPYNPEWKPEGVEDIVHGAIDVAFFVLAHELGLSITATDLQRLANTFRRNLYQGSGNMALFVNGTGDEFNSFIVGIGWIELLRFDQGAGGSEKTILQIAEEVLMSDHPSPHYSDPLLAWAEVFRFSISE